MSLRNDCPSTLVNRLRVCVAGLLLSSLTISAEPPVNPQRFLAALAVVEGGSGSSDGGRAVGPYQMHRQAMLDVQTLTGWRHPLSALRDPILAHRYATNYVRILSYHLEAGGAMVTPSSLWAAWNVGITRFRNRDFSLARCPRNTRERARAIEIYYRTL